MLPFLKGLIYKIFEGRPGFWVINKVLMAIFASDIIMKVDVSSCKVVFATQMNAQLDKAGVGSVRHTALPVFVGALDRNGVVKGLLAAELLLNSVAVALGARAVGDLGLRDHLDDVARILTPINNELGATKAALAAFAAFEPGTIALGGCLGISNPVDLYAFHIDALDAWARPLVDCQEIFLDLDASIFRVLLRLRPLTDRDGVLTALVSQEG